MSHQRDLLESGITDYYVPVAKISILPYAATFLDAKNIYPYLKIWMHHKSLKPYMVYKYPYARAVAVILENHNYICHYGFKCVLLYFKN